MSGLPQQILQFYITYQILLIKHTISRFYLKFITIQLFSCLYIYTMNIMYKPSLNPGPKAPKQPHRHAMGIIPLIELAQIRLIVVPLNEFPPNSFQNYIKILNEKCKFVDLSKLPASSETGN